jgi:hypothetical protein
MVKGALTAIIYVISGGLAVKYLLPEQPKLPEPAQRAESTAGSITMIGQIDMSSGSKVIIYDITTPNISCLVSMYVDSYDRKPVTFPQLGCK